MKELSTQEGFEKNFTMVTHGQDQTIDTEDPDEFLKNEIPKALEDLSLKVKSKHRTIEINLTTKISEYSTIFVYTDDSNSRWVNGTMDEILMIFNEFKTSNSLWQTLPALIFYFLIGFGIVFGLFFLTFGFEWVLVGASLAAGLGIAILITSFSFWLFPSVELETSIQRKIRYIVFVVIGLGVFISILSWYLTFVLPKP